MLKPEAITALDLRRGGADLRQIAEALKTTSHKARKLVDEALEEIYSPRHQMIDKLRALESARLDGYLLNMAKGIKTGDTFSIGAAIKISDRRARLWGLDSATKLDITGDLKINVVKPDDLGGDSNGD